MTSAIVLMLLCAPPVTDIDTVVVCPAEFVQTLEPWLAHRQAQGRRIVVLSNRGSAQEIRAEIRHVAAGNPALRYLMLVGDADPAMQHNERLRERSVPTHHARAEINVKFGSSPEIATDNWYADLNDDRVPDLAIGRLTSDSTEELTLLVQKILQYERSVDFGQWRRRVHFVAGLGGFGPLADTVLEAAAKSLISEGIPAAYCTTMTYGSWQSPYCPHPRDFRQVTLSRLNEGSLFWVYIGHGQQRSVDEVRVPGGKYPIFSTADTAELACQHGAPIACFLACYSGAYDQPRDCLAEEMLRMPGGPVAVMCGSRVTMPYAMSVMGSELLAQCFDGGQGTLGDAILVAKQRMMKTDKPSRHRAALDGIAKALSPTAGELDAERAEHLDLFNLIGDPLLKVPYPQPVEVTVAQSGTAGKTLSVSGKSPLEGSGVVELAVRRDRLTFKPVKRGRFDPAAEGYAETYQRANEPRLVAKQVKFSKGNFAAELAVPADAHGPCYVRVFVEGTDGCAVGAADIRIEAATSR